jgi:hypothetical protein
LFTVVVLYRICIKQTVHGLEDAPIERTVLWLWPFWFGALSNYTFEWIPIQRLTTHDLGQQSGAIISLVVIVIIITIIVIFQAYYLWREGRLSRYMMIYLALGVSIGCLAMIPGVELRLHHYVLALILLPGTSMQTRASLVYQGLLLGLFVNGIARWGFASILQTPASLQEDALYGSPIPSLAVPFLDFIPLGSNITFGFEVPPENSAMDGISVTVNEVERYREFFATDALMNFTWPGGLNQYIRYAFVKDGTILDYSGPMIWFGNGTVKIQQVNIP